MWVGEDIILRLGENVGDKATVGLTERHAAATRSGGTDDLAGAVEPCLRARSKAD